MSSITKYDRSMNRDDQLFKKDLLERGSDFCLTIFDMFHGRVRLVNKSYKKGLESWDYKNSNLIIRILSLSLMGTFFYFQPRKTAVVAFTAFACRILSKSHRAVVQAHHHVFKKQQLNDKKKTDRNSGSSQPSTNQNNNLPMKANTVEEPIAGSTRKLPEIKLQIHRDTLEYKTELNVLVEEFRTKRKSYEEKLKELESRLETDKNSLAELDEKEKALDDRLFNDMPNSNKIREEVAELKKKKQGLIFDRCRLECSILLLNMEINEHKFTSELPALLLRIKGLAINAFTDEGEYNAFFDQLQSEFLDVKFDR